MEGLTLNTATLTATACPTWCIGGFGHDDTDAKVCFSADTTAGNSKLHLEHDGNGTKYGITLADGSDTILTREELLALRNAIDTVLA